MTFFLKLQAHRNTSHPTPVRQHSGFFETCPTTTTLYYLHHNDNSSSHHSLLLHLLLLLLLLLFHVVIPRLDFFAPSFFFLLAL